jgi:hypothetical protein
MLLWRIAKMRRSRFHLLGSVLGLVALRLANSTIWAAVSQSAPFSTAVRECTSIAASVSTASVGGALGSTSRLRTSRGEPARVAKSVGWWVVAHK